MVVAGVACARGDTTVSDLAWVAGPTLRRPILLVALTGLFDAGSVATAALGHLEGWLDATPVATIDPDRYYNFTSQRPTVRLDDDDHRTILWPTNELVAARIEIGSHDLVLLRGDEPHLRWRTYTGLVLEAATTLGCELVVTLGATPAAVPHTRRPRVVGSSTTPDLVRRLGLSSPTYEGPTGLVGVLLDALDDVGLPSVSLRVPVPHYALRAGHPQAIQALLLHVEHVTGAPTGHADLDREIAAERRKLDAYVANDDKIGRYVETLEARYDAELAMSVPSGDELAAELERFLQERDD